MLVGTDPHNVKECRNSQGEITQLVIICELLVELWSLDTNPPVVMCRWWSDAGPSTKGSKQMDGSELWRLMLDKDRSW